MEHQLKETAGNCEYALYVKGLLLRHSGKMEVSDVTTPPSTSFWVNSRTLMRCTGHPIRGSEHPISVLTGVGSKPHLPLMLTCAHPDDS